MSIEKRPRRRFTCTENGLRDQNAHRIASARRAVAAFQDEAGQDDSDGLDTVLTDLLCDLQHLCDNEGLVFERILLLAKMHHTAEVRDA